MDRHIQDFYRKCSDDTPAGHFHSVICLRKEKGTSFESLVEKCPTLCRGWYELDRLSAADRIEFTKEFWISKLPFQPRMDVFLEKFFSRIDDISTYLVQSKFDDPYEPHLVYSLKEGNGFFRGHSGATEGSLLALKQAFPEVIFPEEYLAFLQIHNGFCKTTDSGIIKLEEVKPTYDYLQKLIASKEEVIKAGAEVINPLKLIPFYMSFGMPFFQCFYTEWYPKSEMGNVYYSGSTNSISNLRAIKKSSDENMAFTTFANWLMFYLEALPS